MKHKVIFDTNSVRNAESFSDFLGGRSDLERFLTLAQIIIPDLVIEEIRCQKKKQLTSKRDSFLSNPFHYLLDLNKEDTEKFDMDKWIAELLKTEKIPHVVISLTKNKAKILDQLKDLCLTGAPPFEESSDKGFKDAYIYFTILEYLNNSEDENLFVVTKDDRLRMALQKHRRIRVVRDFDEFEDYNSEYFKDEYFVSRVKEEIDENIEASNIVSVSLNIEENWVLKITCRERVYFLEVDFRSKEIIGFIDKDYSDDINGLVSASNFSATHAYIESLKDRINYFSDDDVQNLLSAANKNDQIYWIAEDEDVKSFFGTLFKAKKSILTDEEKKLFEEHFKHHD